MDPHKTIQTLFHVFGILVILGFLTLQAGGCMIMLAAMNDSGETAGTANRDGSDEVLFGDEDPEANFLRIPVTGVIKSHGEENYVGVVSPSVLETVISLLDHARETPGIDGLLIDIDSPGGAIDPSDIVFHELRRFREETGLPVIANLNGVAASGGYYIAVAADRIIAHPSCITGSIGVIIQAFNYAGLLEKVGLKLQTLTSGPNKDLLNPGRPMNDAERAILMSVIDDAYDSFVDAVSTGRGMDEAVVRELADGRIYTARQAEANGLIDRIGYESDLLDELRQAAGVERVAVLQYEPPSRLWDILGMGLEGIARRASPLAGVRALERLDLDPGLYYLWQPGI